MERKFDSKDYSDMLDMPHHVSTTRPHMSDYDRAAQFSPFQALTGYDEAIDETARLTDSRIKLGERELAALDEKLTELAALIDSRPAVKLVYFVEDMLKEGGRYVSTTGRLKNIDTFNRRIVICDEDCPTDTQEIELDDILELTDV